MCFFSYVLSYEVSLLLSLPSLSLSYGIFLLRILSLRALLLLPARRENGHTLFVRMEIYLPTHLIKATLIDFYAIRTQIERSSEVGWLKFGRPACEAIMKLSCRLN